MPQHKTVCSSLKAKYLKMLYIHPKSWCCRMDKMAEVEISKDGELYLARITLPTGEVITLENEDFEEVLEQVANDLQERFGA